MTSSDWKLGLLIVVGLVGTGGVLAFLGATDREETAPYVTYFDESVHGLDVGSPVKLRGVDVGQVSAIDFAPDRRHVAVTMAVSTVRLRQIGLPVDPDGERVPADLRSRLVSSPLTGITYVSVDFERVATPPRALEFATPPNYIPSRPSTLAGLEEGLQATLARMPGIADRMAVALDRVVETLDGLDARALVADTRAAVANVGSAARATADTSRRLDLLLRDAAPAVARAESALEDIGAAARSLRQLADALERDSDMLLHGRERAK